MPQVQHRATPGSPCGGRPYRYRPGGRSSDGLPPGTYSPCAPTRLLNRSHLLGARWAPEGDCLDAHSGEHATRRSEHPDMPRPARQVKKPLPATQPRPHRHQVPLNLATQEGHRRRCAPVETFRSWRAHRTPVHSLGWKVAVPICSSSPARWDPTSKHVVASAITWASAPAGSAGSSRNVSRRPRRASKE